MLPTYTLIWLETVKTPGQSMCLKERKRDRRILTSDETSCPGIVVLAGVQEFNEFILPVYLRHIQAVKEPAT
jgi:hypothetical protein